MSGRTPKSTPPPHAEAVITDAPLPEPTGPDDDRLVYRLTPQALQYLRERQGAIDAGEDGDGGQAGVPLAQPVARVADVGDAAEAEAKRRRRRDALRRGRRLGTISYVTRGSQQLPLLRLSGKWLREAGFDLGQELEVEVARGRLTLEAVQP